MKVVLASLAALVVCVPFTAPAAAADPLSCAGYPQPRVFLESQSWWSDAGVPASGASKHSHSGTCFPLYQRVSGTLTLDIRSMVHNSHGARLEFVRVQAFQNGHGAINMRIVNPKLPCDSHDCTYWTTISVDLNTLPAGGWWEFRIHTEVQEADRARNLATNGWLAWVDNGKSTTGTTAVPFPQVEGRGWYRLSDGDTVLGYENARLLTRLPDAPVSCTWTPTLRTLRGSGGETIAHSRVTIDPAFHAVPEHPGTVVLDRPGSFEGPVPIDTTRLVNGQHRLVIIGTADTPGNTKLSGVLVLPFVVQNNGSCGSPPPPPPPPPPPDERPRVTVTSPAAHATVSGTITLDATADAGATRVEYYVDGRQVAYDATAPDFDEQWNASSVALGEHTLVARAYIDGVAYESDPVPFHVAARVVVVSPAAGGVVTGTIRVDADAGGASRIDYLVDGVRVAYDATAPDFDESWDSRTVPNGTHTIVARATINGATEDSAPVTFEVRN